MFSIKSIYPLLAAGLLAATGLHGAPIPLTLGQTYAGTIALPGETHNYTFSGSPGQRLYLDSLEGNGLPMQAALYSPSGMLLYQANDDYDSGVMVLIESGAYTLTLTGNAATTGSYEFRMLDLSQAAPVTLGSPLAGQLDPGLACNVYQFDGTRGQRISLQSLAYSSSQTRWELLSPADVVLASGQIYQNLGTLTLPVSGPYVLLVSGASPGLTPVSFSVLAQDVSDGPLAASGFGNPYTGTVNANQTNSFTYAAPAGLPVYFDSLDRSGQSLVVDLLDPNGNAVFSVAETTDAGPYVLPRSGTYTLNVRGASGASGNFGFRLLDCSASPVLPLNAAVSNSLATPYQTDIYQLNGAAGQRLYYDSWAVGAPNAQIQLLGPDGQSLINGSVNYDAGPVTLPFAGVYYFMVQSGLAGATSYAFQMLDLAAQAAVPMNTNFTGILPANTAALYQLSGSQGEQLYFYGKASFMGGAYWTLYRCQKCGGGLGEPDFGF